MVLMLLVGTWYFDWFERDIVTQCESSFLRLHLNMRVIAKHVACPSC